MMKVVLEVNVENIQEIPKQVEKTRERNKRKHWSVDNEVMKKSKRDSLQSEKDRQVRVQKMHSGIDNSKLANIDVDRGSDVDPTSDVPLSTPATTGATIADTIPITEGTIDDDGRTQLKSLVIMLYELAP